MKRISAPQAEVLAILRDAGPGGLTHAEIRDRKANGDSPTSILVALQNRNMVDTAGKLYIKAYLDPDCKWSITDIGLKALARAERKALNATS